MNKKSTLTKTTENKAVWWIGFFTLAITIYFNSKVQDPFNAPKFWILLVGSSWLTGFLFQSFSAKRSKLDQVAKISTIYTSIFLIFSLISIVMAQNKQIAIFGDNMRKNGFLSYVALGIFFITSVIYVRINNLLTFYKFVLATAYLVGGYAILQMTGNDFIPWSSS